MSFAAIKQAARRKLHGGMSFAALVYRDGPLGPSSAVTVRKHTKRTPAGDLAGTNLAYAERREEEPKLVFLVDEFSPERGDVCALETGDRYAVDHRDPPDGVTITVYVTPLSDTDGAAYAIPSTT